MEHHANIVPWHMLVAERGIQLRCDLQQQLQQD
jgi:selenocysteine lyase/cysteine desulfurase